MIEKKNPRRMITTSYNNDGDAAAALRACRFLLWVVVDQRLSLPTSYTYASQYPIVCSRRRVCPVLPSAPSAPPPKHSLESLPTCTHPDPSNLLRIFPSLCRAAQMAPEEKKVALRSSAVDMLEIHEDVAVESNTIKHMTEDDCADNVMPLPKVTGVLAMVVCKKQVEGVLEEQDADFVKDGKGTLSVMQWGLFLVDANIRMYKLAFNWRRNIILFLLLLPLLLPVLVSARVSFTSLPGFPSHIRISIQNTQMQPCQLCHHKIQESCRLAN